MTFISNVKEKDASINKVQKNIRKVIYAIIDSFGMFLQFVERGNKTERVKLINPNTKNSVTPLC